MKNRNHKTTCPLCLGDGWILTSKQYTPEIRAKARKLYKEGMSLRNIGKEIGVTEGSVAQKVKSLIFAKAL